VGDEACHFINATDIATALLGDSIASNLFLLGYAWQRGLVPVSAEALERAIELNGVAIDFNKQAFLWGRRFADQPDRVMSLLRSAEPERFPETLDEVLDDREARLASYQDAAYATRYRRQIEALRAVDPRAEEPGSLTLAAARQLYRMMAIKDEYEVARLYTDGDFQRKLAARFEGDYQLRFNLAPPLLAKRNPDTGELIKQEFGPWVMTAFRILAKLRRLRGTALDVFGYTAERRQERRDLADFSALLETLTAGIAEGDYAAAVEVVNDTARLRGYGHVKDRNRERVLAQREVLLRRFRGEVGEDMVRVVEAA
jgi:indolepyruvate ferredoxin oxidoreductase